MKKDLYIHLDPDQMMDETAHGFPISKTINRIKNILNEYGIAGEITGKDVLNRIDFKSVHDKNLALLTLLQPSYTNKKTGRRYYRFIA